MNIQNHCGFANYITYKLHLDFFLDKLFFVQLQSKTKTVNGTQFKMKKSLTTSTILQHKSKSL